MKAITILNWVAFYGVNASMIAGAMPMRVGLPLMVVAFFFAVWGSLSVKAVENVLAMAQIYAAGVNPNDVTGTGDGKAKAPAA